MISNKIKFTRRPFRRSWQWPILLLYTIILAGGIGTTSARPHSDYIDNEDGKPAVSDNGRFVVFHSQKPDLVIDDSNNRFDIFIHDRLEQKTERISLAQAESEESDGDSYWPDMSGDGRYIVFASQASNLVPDDTNDRSDIFLYDRTTEQLRRISLASDGNEGNGVATTPSISNNGRFITFSSAATNLVANDTNNREDIFVYDQETDELSRISVTSDGEEGDGHSKLPMISGNGRFVAFQSRACTFVSDDCLSYYDKVFRHDRQSGETILVSVTYDGIAHSGDSVAPAINENGRFVTFQSDVSHLAVGVSTSKDNIYVRDLDSNQTKLVSRGIDGQVGDLVSVVPHLDASGRYITFTSAATNLVANDTNERADIFVYDQETEETIRASISSKGVEGNFNSYNARLNGDGRYVAFISGASTLASGDSAGADVFIHEQQTGETNRLSTAYDWFERKGGGGSPVVSADGSVVAFSSGAGNLVPFDNNNATDIFLYEPANPDLQRLLMAAGGLEANNGIHSHRLSENGRFVAFYSEATNIVPNDTNGVADAFVHDRETGETRRVSVASDGQEGNDWSEWISISGDGQTIAFASAADNLVAADNNNRTDIFVHNHSSGETIRVSVDSAGNEGNGDSFDPNLSANGRYLFFVSAASNLVPHDTNGTFDIFAHDLVTRETVRISVGHDGSQGNRGSMSPTASHDGRYVLFRSEASNLVVDDSNNDADLFLHDLVTQETIRPQLTNDGSQTNGHTWLGVISGNGRYIVFESEASNVVANDTNDLPDVFVHDLITNETTRISVAQDGSEADNWYNSGWPSIDHNGRFVAFSSPASNLVPNDTNGSTDVFVLDRETGVLKLISSGRPMPAPTFRLHLSIVRKAQ